MIFKSDYLIDLIDLTSYKCWKFNWIHELIVSINSYK